MEVEAIWVSKHDERALVVLIRQSTVPVEAERV